MSSIAKHSCMQCKVVQVIQDTDKFGDILLPKFIKLSKLILHYDNSSIFYLLRVQFNAYENDINMYSFIIDFIYDVYWNDISFNDSEDMVTRYKACVNNNNTVNALQCVSNILAYINSINFSKGYCNCLKCNYQYLKHRGIRIIPDSIDM
jgi:hypothetical protein